MPTRYLVIRSEVKPNVDCDSVGRAGPRGGEARSQGLPWLPGVRSCPEMLPTVAISVGSESTG